MKKEVLIAIIIGFGLGLVITFGIWSANKAIKQEEKTEPTVTTTPIATPTPTPTPSFDLVVSQPIDNFLSDSETLEISGQSSPDTIIVILYQAGEKILQADKNGNFSASIELVIGANRIILTAYDDQGQQKQKEINVVYSTAEI